MSKKNKDKFYISNQHYIKPKNYDSELFWFKFFMLFSLNLLNLVIIIFLSLVFFLIIFNLDFFSHTGLVFEDNLNFYYYDKNFILLYVFIIFSFTFFLKIRSKYLEKINNDFLNYYSKDFFKNKFIILGISIFLVSFVSIYNFLLFWGVLIKILIFFLFIIPIFLFDFLYISEEKIYIKKPINNYLSIKKSFFNKNLDYFSKDKNNNQKNKSIRLIIDIILIFILFLVFGKTFYQDIKHFSFHSNSKYNSIKLENFLVNNTLYLSHKHLGYESSDSIFNFLELNKNIKGLKIGKNNYKQFITRNINRKLDFIDYGDFDDYSFQKYNNGKNKFDFQFAQNNYNEALEITKKVILENLSYSDLLAYNITDFTDRKKTFSLYYFLTSNNIKYLNIDFNTNIGSSKLTKLSLEKLGNKLTNGDLDVDDIEKIKKEIKKITINDLNLSYSNNFYSFFNDGAFKSDINVNISNFLNKENTYKNFNKKLDLIEGIKNSKVKFDFFDIDQFCREYNNMFDCNILKQRFKDISNENKKEILLNNNYILSNYGKFYKADEYKTDKNQAIFLDVYFALKNRKNKLETLNLSNNYINPFLLENLISKFKNVEKIQLYNLINKADNLIIDLPNSSINAFEIGESNISFLIGTDIDKEKYILMDYKENKTCPSVGENYTYPDIFKDKDLYLNGKGGNICGGVQGNNLGKYYGHFYFSDDFYEFYLSNLHIEYKINEIFTFITKNHLLNINRLSDKNKEFLIEFIKKKQFKSEGEKMFYEFLITSNDLNTGNLESNINLDDKKILNYIYNIKAFVYYKLYLEKYYRYFKSYNRYKMSFNEIFKRENVVIFVKNSNRKIIKEETKFNKNQKNDYLKTKKDLEEKYGYYKNSNNIFVIDGGEYKLRNSIENGYIYLKLEKGKYYLIKSNGKNTILTLNGFSKNSYFDNYSLPGISLYKQIEENKFKNFLSTIIVPGKFGPNSGKDGFRENIKEIGFSYKLFGSDFKQIAILKLKGKTNGKIEIFEIDKNKYNLIK